MDKSQNLNDIWESDNSDGFNILESLDNSEVDDKYILARVEGPAFFPNSISKNKVFYSQEAWEHAIMDPKFQQKLDSRLIYGTIGHNIDLTDDEIREGKFSHIVTKVWIDEHNVGRAEYLILNTPPGVILNTLLRAKSRLRVSTKAGGFFENTLSKDGVKVVIPESFRLERIDFVIEPGYQNALPELIESLDQIMEITKEPIMSGNNDEKVVQILESQITELKTQKQITESTAVQLTENLSQVKQEHAVSSAILENYKAIGTVAAINEAYAELELYRYIGTVQAIHEALDTGEETLDQLTGQIKVLSDELADASTDTDADGYKELGSPEEVKDALDQAIQIATELQDYRDLGTVDELKAVVDNASVMTETIENQQKETLCGKYNVNCDILNNLMSKGMTLDEIEDMLVTIKGVTAETTKPTVTEDQPKESETNTSSDDMMNDKEKDKTTEMSESLSSKLLQGVFSKKSKPINESANAHDKEPKTLSARLMSRK